jgi:hypothetical protein
MPGCRAAHTGDPLPDKIARSSSFPILKSGPEFKKIAPARLKGVSPKARAAIERLQPYHRRKLPEAKSLALLDALCNVDKHRMLHPTASMIIGTQFGITGTGFFELQSVEVFPAELQPRAMVARYTGRFEGDVSFTQHLVLDVIFGRECAAVAARGKSVIGLLLAIRDFIALVAMPALAGLLGGRYAVTSGEAG